MAAMQTRSWLTAGLTTLALAAAGNVHAAGSFIGIGTGDVSGMDYQAGGAICSLVNAGRSDHQIRCTVSSSPGDVENILALRRGEREFGVAQADVVQQAWRGNGAFEEIGEFRGLRTVFALHSETLTLVAHPDADIETVQDLRGKRVNIGPEVSGQSVTMEALMDALGWTGNDFASAERLDIAEQVDAFCDERIDVAAFVTGHPNNAVQETLSCGGAIIPIEGPAINRLVRSSDQYGSTVIPGGTYSGQSTERPTFGVTSLILSSTNTPQRIVQEVTRSVFEQTGTLRDWHRAFNSLEAAGMARGVGAVEVPLHPGAEEWLDDEGLL
jgi:TRAP transporter TAXI family solute receptor